MTVKINEIFQLASSGEEFELELYLDIKRVRDYGADADGKRGINCYVLDDYTFKAPQYISGLELLELNKLVRKYVEGLSLADWVTKQ
jgi:hypothetical protein